MEDVATWALRFLDEHSHLALFLVLLLEESGIPLPLPGDLVVMVAGVRVHQGHMHLGIAWLLMESATLLGSTVLYLLARRGGRPVLYRYGRFLHLDPPKLLKAEAFLRCHGPWAIVLGRIIPGLRIASTLAAGIFGMPYRVYFPALALGASGYLLCFFLLGYFVGPGIIATVEGLQIPVRFVTILVGLGAVTAAYLTIRRRAHLVHAVHTLPEPFRLETALMAGLLATAAMSLVIDLMLYGLASVGSTPAVEALVALGQTVGRRVGARPTSVLIGGITLYVVLQLLWAVLYAHLERWLPEPDWWGGLLFALFPLAVSLWIVLPALGAGVAGLNLGLGLVPLAGELVRHSIYGWALGTSYTLLSRARAATSASRVPLTLPEASSEAL